MNKHLYVVEGKTDISKLKSLGAQYIVQTNGYNISTNTIEFLKLAQKVRKLVFVFDPDGPGRMIEKMLASVLVNFDTVIISKSMSIKNNKVGVAETDVKYLKSKLSKYLEEDNLSEEEDTLTMADLSELGLTGNGASANREMFHVKYFVSAANSKTILRDLNILKVNKKEIMEIYNGK